MGESACFLACVIRVWKPRIWLKMKKKQNLIAAALFCVLAIVMSTQAQQVPQPKTAAEVPGPVPGQIMTEEYASMVGRFAYMWAWPMMNLHNRRDAFDKVTEPVILGVVPAAPQSNGHADRLHRPGGA